MGHLLMSKKERERLVEMKRAGWRIHRVLCDVCGEDSVYSLVS
jgi:hypothetical protein